jgi:uncharacterized membrane protein YbhN (UPF0104 family)
VTDRRTLARLAGFGAGGALFAYVILSSDVARTAALVAQVGAALAWIVPASLLPFLLDACAFRTLLAALGSRPRVGLLLGTTLRVESAVIVLPGGALLGELLRPFLLERNVPISAGVAATLGRKALVAGAHGVVLVACVALGHDFLVARSRDLVGAPGLPFIVLGAGVAVMAAAGLALAGLARGSAAARLQAGVTRLRHARVRAWAASRASAFAQMDEDLRRLLAARSSMAAALAWLVANWIGDALVSALLLRLLGVPIGLVEVLCLDAALSLLRSLVFVVPAGLGIQDLGWATALAALGVPDAAATAAAFVVLKRGKETLWAAIGGLLLAWPARTTPVARHIRPIRHRVAADLGRARHVDVTPGG